MHKLTNEETAKVYAMYLGCDIEPMKCTGGGFSREDDILTIENITQALARDKKLKLTPLDKLKKEDAIEISRLYHNMAGDGIGTISYQVREAKHVERDDYRTTIEFNTGETLRIYNDTGEVTFLSKNEQKALLLDDRSYSARELLKLLGYAVPLFFGVDHWANKKTAIELGIAIENN